MAVYFCTPEIDVSRVESTLVYWVTAKLGPRILFDSIEFDLLHAKYRLYSDPGQYNYRAVAHRKLANIT
jgi:hypothetical protein